MAENSIYFDFGSRRMVTVTDAGCESSYAWLFKDQVVEFVPREAWNDFRACSACGFDFEAKRFMICENAGDGTDFKVTAEYAAPRLRFDYFVRSLGIDAGTSECFKDPEITRAEEKKAAYGGPAPEELAAYIPKNMACNLAAAAVNQLLYGGSDILGADYEEDIRELTEVLFAAHEAYDNDEAPEKNEIMTAVIDELTEIAASDTEASDDAQSILELIAVYTGLQQRDVEEFLF